MKNGKKDELLKVGAKVKFFTALGTVKRGEVTEVLHHDKFLVRAEDRQTFIVARPMLYTDTAKGLEPWGG
jgi:hypothetical protein